MEVNPCFLLLRLWRHNHLIFRLLMLIRTILTIIVFYIFCWILYLVDYAILVHADWAFFLFSRKIIYYRCKVALPLGWLGCFLFLVGILTKRFISLFYFNLGSTWIWPCKRLSILINLSVLKLLAILLLHRIFSRLWKSRFLKIKPWLCSYVSHG